MDRLEQIKNEVAREKYNTSWNDLLYDMYPDDTYVNDALSRYEIDVMMEEVARRYATEMVRHDRERVADNAGLIDSAMNIRCKSGHGLKVDKQSITSLEIELI